MSWQILPFLFPLIAVIGISLALAIYVWRRRESAPIARPLALLLLGMAEWAAAYALELASPGLLLKIFWAQAELFGAVVVATTSLIFALRYTGSENWLKPRYLISLISLSALAVLLVWTNDWHHWVWPRFELEADGPFPFLRATHGTGFWLVLGFGYLLTLTGAILLVSAQLRSARFFRLQIGAALVALAAPILANIISFLDLGPLPLLDWTPFSFLVVDAVAAWGILHYHILDIAPSARDAIIEHMRDGVIIINAAGRIVDLNAAAERIIHRPAALAIGQPADERVFEPLGVPENLRRATEGHVDIAPGPDRPDSYELDISPFHTPLHHLAGRFLVLHETTQRRAIEEALHESEQRYRAVSELTSDYAYSFDIRPDGRVILNWVSDSFSRMTGYSPDQIKEQGEWFLNLALPEDGQVALEQGLAVLAGKEDIREFRYVTRTGDIRWIRNCCQPVWDASHEHVTGFFGAAQDITERKRTEARLERNAQELRGLYHMGQTVLSSLDLDTVLNQVIEELRTLVGASDVSVLFLENEELVFAAVAGASASVLQGQHIPANAGVAGEVVTRGRAVRVSGDKARAAVYQDIETITEYHTHTLLAAPIKVGEKVIGVMEAVHTESEAFTEDDLRTLEAAASWAAIAIDNARQHKDLQRRLQESRGMAAISQALTETLDLERIFQLIVNTAQQTLPQVEQAVIHLLDEKEQALFSVAVAGLAERARPGLTMHPGEGVAGRVMAEGIVMNVPDISADARYLPLGSQSHLHSLMVAPVQGGGRRLGTISVASTTCNAFTANDERLLAHLGAQAAIAIEKARLYQAEREQRMRAEAVSIQNEQLYQAERQRLEKAVALQRVTQAVSSHLDLRKLLETIVAALSEIANYEYICVYFVDDVGLRLMAQCGYGAGQAIQLIPRGRGVVGRVIRTCQAALVTDVEQDPDYIPAVPAVHSDMAVPLTHGQEITGVLLVETAGVRELHRDDLDWLIGVGQQLSVALENARLYEDLQDALRQEQAMRDQLVQADKLAAIGQMAASVAHELNNPLQAIQGCLDLAEAYPNDSAKQQHYLVMAKGEVERLAAIVRRMLDYYRPAKGTREWVDVRALVSDVLALAGKRLSQGKVIVRSEWDKDLPPIQGIGNQLKQVFLNIILNAVDAMPRGGDLEIHGRVVDHADRKWLTIEFKDTGVGIPQEDLRKIFEPFYTTRVTGTGLGLAVSHNIVTHHHGQLTVESVVGQGSAFTVWLPLTQ